MKNIMLIFSIMMLLIPLVSYAHTEHGVAVSDIQRIYRTELLSPITGSGEKRTSSVNS